MRRFVHYLDHLLLGAILGMIFIALSHTSPTTEQIIDLPARLCPATPKLLIEAWKVANASLAAAPQEDQQDHVVMNSSARAPYAR